MRFFLDENIPKNVATFLIKEGHEIIDIRGTEREGLSDKDIFNLAQENEAIFLTTDRDFFHTIPHLYKNHFGIIVFNLKQPNRYNITEKLDWALKNIDLTKFNSNVLLLRDKYYTHIKKET